MDTFGHSWIRYRLLSMRNMIIPWYRPLSHSSIFFFSSFINYPIIRRYKIWATNVKVKQTIYQIFVNILYNVLFRLWNLDTPLIILRDMCVPHTDRHFRPIVTAVVERHGHLYWIVKGFCNLEVVYRIGVGTSCSEREKNDMKTRSFSITAESPNATN